MTTAAKVRAVAALARLAKTTPRPPLAAVTLCPSLHDGSCQADIAAVLREALRRIDGARVVVFSRSNLFRVALASHGTHRRKPACGPGEVLETRYPLQHFSCELPHVVAYRANLYAVAKEVGAPFREILFEDLINDPAGTMSRLGAWLGVGADATRRLADAANATVGPKRAPRPPVRDCVSAATAAPDGSDFRLRNRPAFEAALGALAERAAATGAANGACLRAMPRAPNDQAFPSVISFHDPAARSDCGKKDPKYACVAE